MLTPAVGRPATNGRDRTCSIRRIRMLRSHIPCPHLGMTHRKVSTLPMWCTSPSKPPPLSGLVALLLSSVLDWTESREASSPLDTAW